MIKYFLLLVDIIIIIIAFFSALFIRFQGIFNVIQNQTGSVIFILFTTPILFYINDLYTHNIYVQPLRVFSKMLRAWILSFLLYIIIGYISNFYFQIESRAFILIFYFLAFFLFVFIRIIFIGLLLNIWFRSGNKRRMCRYIGPGRLYTYFADFFSKNPVAGIILLNPEEMENEKWVDNFIYIPDKNYENCYNEIKRNITLDSKLHVASPIFKNLNLDWGWCSIDNIPVYTYLMKKNYKFYNLAKRIVDILGSLSALVILFPFFVIVSIAIKINSLGPIIYKQKRCGLGGASFTFYKFRSMLENVSENVKFDNGQFYDSVIRKTDKMNAKNITGVGNILRKSSIDEWPQLLNVLKGEMSLVGPRPHQQYEVDCYRPWHKDRLSVMQGLTGVWQIYGRGELPSDKSIFLDLNYVLNRSLTLDIKLLFQTIPAVILGKGAY